MPWNPKRKCEPTSAAVQLRGASDLLIRVELSLIRPFQGLWLLSGHVDIQVSLGEIWQMDFVSLFHYIRASTEPFPGWTNSSGQCQHNSELKGGAHIPSWLLFAPNRSLSHTVREKNCKLDSEPILPQTAKAERATWLLMEMLSGMSRRCYSPATAKQTALQPDPSVSNSLHRSSLAISQHVTVPW